MSKDHHPNSVPICNLPADFHVCRGEIVEGRWDGESITFVRLANKQGGWTTVFGLTDEMLVELAGRLKTIIDNNELG